MRIIIIFTLLYINQTFAYLNAQDIDPWVIKAENWDKEKYAGVTVANGMIGIVSSQEPFKVKDVVLSGAYDLYGRGRVSNFLRSFNLLNMQVGIDGEQINKGNIQNLNQTLDMKNGRFSVRLDFGDKAVITYSYYALRQLPFCVLMDVSITAKKDITLGASSVMEAPDALKEVQNYYNEIDRPHVVISLLTSLAKSPTGKLEMAASTSFLFSEHHGNEPRVIHEMWDNNMHLMKFSKKLKAGETYSFAITGSSITSAHHDDPLNEAERLTIFSKLEGKDRLINNHKAAWQELWKSDIQIVGDEQAQQDVHSMLYHLYSFVREGSNMSISPMGLSGLGYNGHIFWDSELWMYPALLVMQPKMAKSMIQYRFDRLEAARRNAFNHGYKGAMFPWESAGTGVEETPVWALSGPFEHHITGCVGFAAWNYFAVTQDKDWLRNTGWPLLKETADFWASRVERKGPGKFEINNVVAADEWAENVDNNAFTNAVAITNLKAATKAAVLLGFTPDPDWLLVAQNIPILKMKEESSGQIITQEHATYKGEGIKQADVNLLAFPLKFITDTAQIRRDLIYYSSRVPDQGTPAMTHAIFSLLSSRLGDSQKAYQFFKESYEPNLNPPFRVIAETKGGTNPYFGTGAGGVLQAVLMGFGGLDITDKGINQVKSTLPKNWQKLIITGVSGKTYVVE
ncbi:MAG: glycoside hydrolase family 65 protein [Saprospiraceae bacterium]